MDYKSAKKIFNKNFIGPDELKRIANDLSIAPPASAPEVPFSEEILKKCKNDYLLILGVGKDVKGNPLTINQFRETFGVDSSASEPCMYNQDWYLKEKFASETTLENKWYLVSKKILEDTRAVLPGKIIEEHLRPGQQFPSAILTTFTFFAYYFLNDGEMLWKHDFVWCNDTDNNGDRIYTGRYVDPKGINKNGFNIHRHLSLRPAYGSAPEITV